MPVSVFVTVTSAPGIDPPLESRTTPDSCEPATACACAVPLATRARSATLTNTRNNLTRTSLKNDISVAGGTLAPVAGNPTELRCVLP